MMCLPVDLSLELKLPTGPPATTAAPSSPFQNGAAVAEKRRGMDLEEYVRKLEMERRKIDVFRRELPLTVIILDDVIGELKEELVQRGDGLTAGNKTKEDKEKADWMSAAHLWCDNSSITTTSASIDEEKSGVAALHDGTRDPSPSYQRHRRKSRRWWSPELHKLFVNALETLGGLKAATPKKVKEIMKVEGLTNEEIKSHLQKFRLRAQRLTTASSSTTN